MDVITHQRQMQEETRRAVAGILKEDPDLNQNKDSEVEILWRKRILEEEKKKEKKSSHPTPKVSKWKKDEAWLTRKSIDNRYPVARHPTMLQKPIKPSGIQNPAPKPEAVQVPAHSPQKEAPKRHYLSETSSDEEWEDVKDGKP